MTKLLFFGIIGLTNEREVFGMGRDRLIPCKYYTAYGHECQKGRISDMKGDCRHCKKYDAKDGYKVIDKRKKEKYKYYE